MAEAVVLPLVSKLQEVALSEGRALVGVGGDINRLRDKLMWLLAFLQEADPQRRAGDAGELMRVLVHQTRDAAFSAEDALDDYAVRVDLSRYPGWSRAVIGFLAGITTQVRVRHRLSNDIAAIHARLEEIVGNKDKYRLEGSAPSSLLTWTASAASSSVSLHWLVKHSP
uniref:Disease resistance N-terminal domain-containing protein n=1 Tax=Oryza punctata TaxID=4537 RepID=A0A0E0LTE9_ORYPU